MLSALQSVLTKQNQKPWFLPTVAVLFIQSPQVAAAWITLWDTVISAAPTVTMPSPRPLVSSLCPADRKRNAEQEVGEGDR